MKKISWPSEWCSTCIHPLATENSANWSRNSQQSWKNSGRLTSSWKRFRRKIWRMLTKLMTLKHYASLGGSTVCEIDHPQSQGRSSSWQPVFFRWKVQLQLGHVIFIRTYENIYRQLVFSPENLPFSDHRVSTNFDASRDIFELSFDVMNRDRRWLHELHCIVELLNEHWCFA